MMLVRHGQSLWNVPFGNWRIDAGITDPELTETGRDQARLAAQSLAKMQVARLVTSPYKRCLETAQIISSILGVDISINPLVRERCAFSCDQGSAPEGLSARWPSIDFTSLEDVWWGGAIESAVSIEKRAQQFLAQSLTWPDRERVAVISHWGFIRAATGQMADNAEIVHWPA